MVVCLVVAGFLQLYVVTPQPVMASPDSAGPNTAGTASGTNWVDPTNTAASDNNYAIYDAKLRDDLKLTNFGFSIPTEATINGIVVTREGHGTGILTKREYQIGLTKDGSALAGTRKTGQALPSTTDDTVDIGSSTDLWGTTWTAADINATTFGVLISDNNTKADELDFDYIAVTIYYRLPPSVTSVVLSPTSMTPQAEYSVTVAVSDADNLSDLTTVVLKVWYDSDGGAPTEAEFDGKTVGNTQSCAIITYTLSGDTFTIDPSADTSWSLGTCTPFTSGEKAATSGDCIFVFTPGKVATQTTGSDNWQIAAKATDSASETGWNYDTTPGATMNWYGEIDVPDATTADWGFVAPGLDFGEDTASEEAVGVTITYISNGAYDKKVKTTSPWSGSSYTATFDSTGACSSANEFALKADDTGTLSSAVLVDTSGVIIDNTGGQTTEAGDEVTTHTLWLKLASSFNSDTYSGTIMYIIAEHV